MNVCIFTELTEPKRYFISILKTGILVNCKFPITHVYVYVNYNLHIDLSKYPDRKACIENDIYI